MDEDQNSEEEEVTPQDQDSTIVDEQTQEEVQGDPPGQEGDPQDRNWRELRRKNEAAESKNQQYEEKLQMQDQFIKSLLTQNQNQNTVPAQPEVVDKFAQIPQEEYPTFGQTRDLVRQDSRAIAREEFIKLERERDAVRFRERLQAKYPDFDEVVNSETIALLDKQEPELASTIADLKDPYKMGLQTYNFLKSMNLGGSSDDKRHAKEVAKKIDKNEKTVQSPQAYSKRPMAQAFSMSNMSTEEKQGLYDEMMGHASRTSGY